VRDPLAPVRVVSVTDPAIVFADVEARERYRASRDPALIPAPRDGCAPCVFVVQPVSAEIAIRLDGINNLADRALLAFRACVHRVELPGGEALVAAPYSSNWLGELAPEEWVKTVALRVGPRRVYEIGEAAYRLSMLDDLDPLLPSPGQPPPS